VAGCCKASHDAQDAWDTGDASLASGRNTDGSDAGSVFADVQHPSSASHVLDMQTDVVGECPDSNFEYDPKPTGCENDVLSSDVVYKSDTEVLNNTASFSRSQQRHFPGTGEAIGAVTGSSKKSVICATTHGHHSLAGKGSGLPLGSLRVKFRSHESTKISRVA